MGCGPGPGKGGQKKSKNTTTCSGHPIEPQNENRFFRFQAEDLLNLRMVWIAL